MVLREKPGSLIKNTNKYKRLLYQSSIWQKFINFWTFWQKIIVKICFKKTTNKQETKNKLQNNNKLPRACNTLKNIISATVIFG